MTRLQVGNCGECPFMLECQDKLDNYTRQKEDITKLAVDESIDTIVAPVFMEIFREYSDFAHDDTSGFETEQDIAATFRKNAAAMLEDIDQQEDMLVTMANIGAAACQGPLKMRANKGDVTATVTLCNNPNLPAGQQMESVVVARQRRS